LGRGILLVLHLLGLRRVVEVHLRLLGRWRGRRSSIEHWWILWWVNHFEISRFYEGFIIRSWSRIIVHVLD
jgi:hypothetical protein